MTKCVAVAALLVAVAMGAAHALAQANPVAEAVSPGILPEMRFEVATIKLSPADAHVLSGPHGSPEIFDARMATVESMIAFCVWDSFLARYVGGPQRISFCRTQKNLVGGPTWVANDKYDLTAKADAATMEAWGKMRKEDQEEELKRMLRALLEERFHLVMRHETRQMTAWALVVVKGGPKFGATAGPPPDLNDGSNPAKPFDSSKPYQGTLKLDRGVIKPTRYHHRRL